MPNSDTDWPPPWTLKPTEGEPHDSSHLDGESIGWDLSFGFRLNVDHDDCEDESTPLTINAHFSDADRARGFVKREVTPEQLQEFARLLLNLAAQHKQRQQATTVTRPYEPHPPSLGEQTHDADTCRMAGQPHLGPCIDPAYADTAPQPPAVDRG